MTQLARQSMKRRLIQGANTASQKTQSGVMLLEALLGMLIFSMGILAVVGIQTVAIKTVAESRYRMEASFLANEVIGEMWANRAALGSYAYAGGTVPAVLTNWVNKVNGALPGIAANPPTITIAGQVVTVTVFWQLPEEANLATPPPPHQYITIASIDCC